MSGLLHPTAFGDVNEVLLSFLASTRALLGEQFRGMYLYGSLALGDFDPRSSDIDYLIMTDGEVGDDVLARLDEMHARFNVGDSPWAGKTEAAYIPEAVLRGTAPSGGRYPQIEKGGTLVRAPLENGWVFQCHSLREQGVVVAGPEPQALIPPIEAEEMRRATATIVGGWLDQARNDPTWLDWMRPRVYQSFVLLTLCRLLNSLETGGVASKPAAARWAQEKFGDSWSGLIAGALTGRHDFQGASDQEVRDTIAFLEFAWERVQQDGVQALAHTPTGDA
jgi:aminoglycoside adenylyltransferase-like protein/nucleotidyltransferase-like protein